jgi:hypothetical protein
MSSPHSLAAEYAELMELQDDTKPMSVDEKAEMEKSNNKLRTSKVCLGPNNTTLDRILAMEVPDDGGQASSSPSDSDGDLQGQSPLKQTR